MSEGSGPKLDDVVAATVSAIGLPGAVRRLKPSLIFVSVWVGIEIVLHLVDAGETGLLRGVRPPVAVPVALVIGAVVVDALRFRANLEWIGQANVWLVFLLPHQLGYFYAEGRLARLPRSVFVAMALGSIATMLALTNLYRFFPGISVYPRSLLGTDVGTITNTTPPTAMMLAMAIWSIGAAMLARPLLARWLQRARVWKAVVFTNTIVMTLFLWHMTAYLVAVLLLWPLGLGRQGDTTGSWWAERPIWEFVPAVFLVGLVALFGRFERPRLRPRSAIASESAAGGIG